MAGIDKILFFDLEVEGKYPRIKDIGACWQTHHFHGTSLPEFARFAQPAEYICGHNILKHDLPHLAKADFDAAFFTKKKIDTLYLSALLFPEKPYHKLVKDYKLFNEHLLNDPLADSQLTRDLLRDEVKQFHQLPEALQNIYAGLLASTPEFSGFFHFLSYPMAACNQLVQEQIEAFFRGQLCQHTDLKRLITEMPVVLAYALAILTTQEPGSISPPWLIKNYPALTAVLQILRLKGCPDATCGYCHQWLDPVVALDQFFGYPQFRKFDPAEEVSLQEQVVRAALDHRSLVAIFPTGGGKSLTFQLPALLAGRATKALTVVISPLQSLMKDQVDVLKKRHGIVHAVTINGLLSPLERSEAIERVMTGEVHLLYISPESLRSKTIADLLRNRTIARFVIDEAHCFSAWGHDFRVDYLYIGEFIAQLQQEKHVTQPIPVSCFTATAKPQVIQDIQSYFDTRLSLQLDVFKASTKRLNLTYAVQNTPSTPLKYQQLKSLLSQSDQPAIVYVSRVRMAEELAESLTRDGFDALAYHGQMDTSQKISNQDQFINNEVNIMVATTAFGMGVDKNNVGMVIHYEISDSLENYVQEAGRAGRSEDIQAGCYVLFDENDLNKHFSLLNQSKLNQKEIAQIWKGVKSLAARRYQFSKSALEIARAAGWDADMHQLETRVTAAIAALEDGGYVKRGQNSPRIFANSFKQKNIDVANEIVRNSTRLQGKDEEHAIRIIQRIVKEDETRVDYLSEVLAIPKEDIMRVLQLLRQENIIGDAKDLTAFIDLPAPNHPLNKLRKYAKLETKLLAYLPRYHQTVFLKEINEWLIADGLEDTSPEVIKDVWLYWETKNFITKTRIDRTTQAYEIRFRVDPQELQEQVSVRLTLAARIAEYLVSKRENDENQPEVNPSKLLEFSVLELKEAIETQPGLLPAAYECSAYEAALLYLNAIGAIKLEGGFLILYNALSIERLERSNQKKYTKEDYQKLETHYQHKAQQIHIVGEYAKKMLVNYQEALTFVDDYFTLQYDVFLKKYFPSRQGEIKKALSPQKFQDLFGILSTEQLAIVNSIHPHLLVTAGPGSGKTRVLVHKVASLLLIEDIKPDQFLMLTFSRAAALEFKERLKNLVGNAAYYVDIHTYHGYCFNLLGRIGTLEKSDTIIRTCLEAIRSGTIAASTIASKSVVVVDEFQDINAEEYRLLSEIIRLSDDIRVIVVGDDNQNIYEFRGASSRYMFDFATQYKAHRFNLIRNFRSQNNLVQFSNQFLTSIQSRLKKEEILSYTTENGLIRLVKHAAAHLIFPLVTDVHRLQLPGTTAILTPTNEAALLVANELRKNGIPARHILSTKGFGLGDLVEIRHFTNAVLDEGVLETGYIPNAWWEQTKQETFATFAQSDKLWLCQKVLKQFEKAFPRKFASEWKAYLREITFEDFYYPEQKVVLVSTMHKAKGKEFDNVFLLLENFPLSDDAARRVVYVALTRAKQNLVIHTNQSNFDSIQADNLTREYPAQTYPPADEICLELSHQDVYLGGFAARNIACQVSQLLPGELLWLGPDGISLVNGKQHRLVRFSRSFEEKLAKKQQEGYSITEATVNFIVYWRNKEDNSEHRIILPKLILKKAAPNNGH